MPTNMFTFFPMMTLITDQSPWKCPPIVCMYKDFRKKHHQIQRQLPDEHPEKKNIGSQRSSWRAITMFMFIILKRKYFVKLLTDWFSQSTNSYHLSFASRWLVGCLVFQSQITMEIRMPVCMQQITVVGKWEIFISKKTDYCQIAQLMLCFCYERVIVLFQQTQVCGI